jgi:hypothetical protein
LQERFQQNDFDQHFLGCSPGEIYGKIRLAEISHRCPPNTSDDAGLMNRFIVDGMYSLSPLTGYQLSSYSLPLDLAKRLRLVCERAGFNSVCSKFNCLNEVIKRTGTGSFLHLAAASGHMEYVMTELQEDTHLLNHDDKRVSLELSALFGRGNDLVSELLGSGGSLQQHISLHHISSRPEDRHRRIETAPIWIIAMYMTLESAFNIYTTTDSSLRDLRIFELILKHVIASIGTAGCEICIIHRKETWLTLGNTFRVLALYYSSSKHSNYMNQDCWKIVERISANSTTQWKSYEPNHDPSELKFDEGSEMLDMLKSVDGFRKRVEVRFQNYVMNDERCFSVY